MRDWLRRLFRGKRQDAPPAPEGTGVAPPPPPKGAGAAPPPPDDSDLRQRMDQLERQALAAIHQQRAAEALLTPQERIKTRLSLPPELPADYRADGSVLVLAPPRPAGAGPYVVVVTNGGVGLQMPRVLFEYLYRGRAPTADEERVINDALGLWGLEPEAL